MPQRAGGKRREEELLESVRRGETLLREVHHRVKNNLQIVASLLALQSGAASDDTVRQALSDAVNRISTIALIHAQLSEAPNVTSVDMRAFIQELVDNVRRTSSDLSSDIATSVDVDPISLDLHLATPCGLIISELLTNAFQHAFARADHGVIQIRLVSDGRRVTLAIRDSGRGLPADTAGHASGGLGLHLVRLLATRQLRGRVTITRRRGTEFTVRFPLATRSPMSRRVHRRRERKTA